MRCPFGIKSILIDPLTALKRFLKEIPRALRVPMRNNGSFKDINSTPMQFSRIRWSARVIPIYSIDDYREGLSIVLSISFRDLTHTLMFHSKI